MTKKYFSTKIKVLLRRRHRRHSVWPDLYIFERFGQQIFSSKLPKYLATLWAVLNNITMSAKLQWQILGQLLENIGQLLIPKSGHSVVIQQPRNNLPGRVL